MGYVIEGQDIRLMPYDEAIIELLKRAAEEK